MPEKQYECNFVASFSAQGHRQRTRIFHHSLETHTKNHLLSQGKDSEVADLQ